MMTENISSEKNFIRGLQETISPSSYPLKMYTINDTWKRVRIQQKSISDLSVSSLIYYKQREKTWEAARPTPMEQRITDEIRIEPLLAYSPPQEVRDHRHRSLAVSVILDVELLITLYSLHYSLSYYSLSIISNFYHQ